MPAHNRRPGRDHAGQAGFSLPEMMVATAILATAIASLGQLLAIAMVSNRGARATTYAAMLASQKMEQLRGVVSTELTPSPAGALGGNTIGYVDYLDAYGRSLAGGESPPAGTTYVRRWSIEPLPANPDTALVLQVLVTDLSASAARGRGSIGRMPHDARLVSVRMRKGA